MPKRYAKGKFAVGECARSGRKMLLKDMVSDGYYPSLVVDPEWYEGKHPQESLPEIEDPVALWRPAPERDLVGARVDLGAPDINGEVTSSLSYGYEVGGIVADITPQIQNEWNLDSVVTPDPDVGGGAILYDLTYALGPTTGEPSLRADMTGNSMLFDSGSHISSTIAGLIYSGGFTVEYITQPTVIGVRAVLGGTSRIVPSVHSHLNQTFGIFELGFDNWGAVGSSLFPNFVLMKSTNYDVISDKANVLATARGSTAMIVNNVYHLLGTVRTDGLVQLYVNGVIAATTSVDFTDFVGTGVDDLSDSGRADRLDWEVGVRFLDGAHRNTANAGAGRIDNVRFYTAHLNATEAANAAAAAAFT